MTLHESRSRPIRRHFVNMCGRCGEFGDQLGNSAKLFGNQRIAANDITDTICEHFMDCFVSVDVYGLSVEWAMKSHVMSQCGASSLTQW